MRFTPRMCQQKCKTNVLGVYGGQGGPKKYFGYQRSDFERSIVTPLRSFWRHFLNLFWEKTQSPLAKPKTKNAQWRNSKTQTQIMAKPTTHKLNTGETPNPTWPWWKFCFKMMCGVFHISANKEEFGLTWYKRRQKFLDRARCPLMFKVIVS